MLGGTMMIDNNLSYVDFMESHLVSFETGSMVFSQPNELMMAFSIRSFRDHKALLRKSSEGPMTLETISALFPPELIQSVSFAGFSIVDVGNGLLKNIGATVIQSLWRGYVARRLAAQIKAHWIKSKQRSFDEDFYHQMVLTSQTAVRRYLAMRKASQLREDRRRQEHAASLGFSSAKLSSSQRADGVTPPGKSPRHHNAHGTLMASDLPPGSKFNEHGERIGGEWAEGAFAMQCAATVIQAQVRRRVAQKLARARMELRRQRYIAAGGNPTSEHIPILSRKYSAVEGVLWMAKAVQPNQPSASTSAFKRAARASISSVEEGYFLLANLSGKGMAAVFWDASGILLNPRTNAASPQTSALYGLQILHCVLMERKKASTAWWPSLPLTLWVQGPLLSDEERSKNDELMATKRTQTPLNGLRDNGVLLNRQLTPRGQQQRSARHVLTPMSARKLSPLGKSPRGVLPMSPRK